MMAEEDTLALLPLTSLVIADRPYNSLSLSSYYLVSQLLKQ